MQCRKRPSGRRRCHGEGATVQFRVQFLDASGTIIREMLAEAWNAAGAIALVKGDRMAGGCGPYGREARCIPSRNSVNIRFQVAFAACCEVTFPAFRTVRAPFSRHADDVGGATALIEGVSWPLDGCEDASSRRRRVFTSGRAA